MWNLRSKEQSRRSHPAGRMSVPPEPATPATPDPPAVAFADPDHPPVVDAFLEALRELERCRLRFGSWPDMIEPERTRLDEARRAVVQAWTHRAA